MESNADVVIDEKIEQKITFPNTYHVILLNDDTTPIEWVVEILASVFKHSNISAESLTLEIHNEGSAVVGTYQYEIAEQKAIETTNLSRDKGFPLQVKVEENK
jgi:ATP-dependent Clp protease adaptor protein ClpS